MRHDIEINILFTYREALSLTFSTGSLNFNWVTILLFASSQSATKRTKCYMLNYHHPESANNTSPLNEKIQLI